MNMPSGKPVSPQGAHFRYNSKMKIKSKQINFNFNFVV
jgi:hypothetical protein